MARVVNCVCDSCGKKYKEVSHGKSSKYHRCGTCAQIKMEKDLKERKGE